MSKLQFVFDDGGRKDSGRKGSAGDCVCRSIAIAAGRPYSELYASLAAHSGKERGSRGKSARNGIHTSRKWFKDFMASMRFKWTPTMLIGSGCKVHLSPGELPTGRLVVALSGHYTAVIDGVIHDTHDPQREITTFRVFPGWETAELKPTERRNVNGIFSTSRRCVYGYWQLDQGLEAACAT